VISFVVPAHDEEALLPRTLEAIRRSVHGLGDVYEVVVVDDDSTDGTSVVAKRHGARVVSVRLRQISASRNAGAREAIGDVLMFIDADTVVTPAVLHAAFRATRGGAVGGGCTVRFDGRLPLWARILQPLVSWTYRTVGLAAGCFLFCTRRAFIETGGFDESIFAGEEAVMSGRLKRIGRFVVLHEHVVTSGRKLRAYSGLEIARSMCRLAALGRRGVGDRRNLDIWYGPRRPDPDGNGSDGGRANGIEGDRKDG
jgi:glycosyltransferase involved in cell wall biosynthesis